MDPLTSDQIMRKALIDIKNMKMAKYVSTSEAIAHAKAIARDALEAVDATAQINPPASDADKAVYDAIAQNFNKANH